MPETDTTVRADSALQTAYDRYVDANAAHTILCADPKATATDRFNAAVATHRAFQAFLTTDASPDADASVRNSRHLQAVCELEDAVRRAHAMLLAVDAGGLIDQMPEDRAWRGHHQAGVSLVLEAQDILKASLDARAGAEPRK